MNKASLKIRFLTTMGANVIRAVLAFCAGMIIAKSLGPAAYGSLSFLLGSFAALSTLVNLASSSAFYTFISQRQRGRKFFLYYTFWVLVQLLLLLLLVLLLPGSLKTRIWFEHPTNLVILALFASFAMNQIWQYAGQVGESIRDTVGVQIRNLVLAGAYLMIVAALSGFNLIGIRILFVLNIILYLSCAVLYGLRLYRIGTFAAQETESLRPILGEFITYCWPLILSAWVGFLYSFADYWLLQNFGGSVQQGYYAIGARFSALSLIATTSILQIFWKEIAEANSLGNMDKVRRLYGLVSRGLFFLGAAIGCLMIPFSREILSLFLGPAYQAAWVPLSLMFFYPIHQSMGQITGTMLIATGRTKVQSAIGIAFMAISIPTAYFLLASRSAIVPGFDLGAMGLAIKMVGCQVLGVNLSAFFVARYIDTAFNWSHQIYVVLLLLPIGFLSKFFVRHMLFLASFDGYAVLVMVCSGMVYLISIGIIVRCFPSLAGLDTEQINRGLSWLRSRNFFA